MVGIAASSHFLKERGTAEGVSIDTYLDHVDHTYAVAVATGRASERMEKEIRELFPDSHYFGAPSISEIHASMDPARFPATIALLKNQNAFLNPTLMALWVGVDERKEKIILENSELLAEPGLHYIPGPVRMNILRHPHTINVFQRFDSVSPKDAENYRQGYENVKRFLSEFVKAGGKVVAGVDAVFEILPGVGTHQEMELLVGAGLTPLQALLAATRWTAEAFRIQDRVGTLEKGKLADLLVLSANPLEDIRNTRSIEIVLQGGKRVERGFHAEYSIPIRRPCWEVAGTIHQIDPVMVPRGSGPVRLVVEGEHFPPQGQALVTFDGVPLRTQIESSRRAEAELPAHLLSRVGTFPLRVYSPGEGTASNAVDFLVKFE